MAQADTALAAKVENLESGHMELRKEFRILDAKMDAGFTAIGHKIDARTTPQWQPVGIIVSVLLAFGGAIIFPIRESMMRQEALMDQMRREAETRIIKLWDEQNKTARDVSTMQGRLSAPPLPPR